MAGPAFIDTNILVYAQDSRDYAKQAVARPLVRRLLGSGQGLISSQVVQEYCAVAFNPYKPLTADDLRATLDLVLVPMLAHFPDAAFYRKAINLKINQQLNFYDALIVQAAIDLGCQTLYSEDLHTGRVYSGVQIVDPFK